MSGRGLVQISLSFGHNADVVFSTSSKQLNNKTTLAALLSQQNAIFFSFFFKLKLIFNKKKMGSKLQSKEEKLFDDVFQHYLLIFHLAVLDGQLRYCALFTPSIR